MINKFVTETPWDTKALKVYTAELIEYSAQALKQISGKKGLYTIKVDPLVNKKLLNQYDFYYCDTLIKPVCDEQSINTFTHTEIEIGLEFNTSQLLEICGRVFLHGRYHRDHNIADSLANQRYVNWLSDLINNEVVYSLTYKGQLAGFIAVKDSDLILHAVDKQFQGKGLSKYWWSLVCQDLFLRGYKTISSSVSASNLPVINLYSRLGFKFVHTVDVYHKFVE